MSRLVDCLYLLAGLLASPWLAYRVWTTGKYRRGLLSKLVGSAASFGGDAPRAWFHGVSVGEVILLEPVIRAFRQRRPGWHCVISTTTDTGYEEARRRFPDTPVFFWPFDFSWAVRRALRRVNPSLVVLAEGELWPNFLAAARARAVPVAVVNARMSPRSFRRYRALRPLARRLLAGVQLFLVQSAEYAGYLTRLGVEPGRVRVTGSVKYDGVTADAHNSRTEELRRVLAVRPGQMVWIAGSTQAPEEDIVLGIYSGLRTANPNLRLVLVPRQRERFEPVASLLARRGMPFVRRSELKNPADDPCAVVLVDTIGELGALWGLADLAFVGGSLDGRRGGQNMIEPAAYGVPVLFGPHVWNFRETADRLLTAEAAVQVADVQGLEKAVRVLLGDPAERRRLGEAARRFVTSQQGAAERTAQWLDQLVAGRIPAREAA